MGSGSGTPHERRSMDAGRAVRLACPALGAEAPVTAAAYDALGSPARPEYIRTEGVCPLVWSGREPEATG